MRLFSMMRRWYANRKARHQDAAACQRPPANRTYLAVGQDLFAIDDYINAQYNYSLHEWEERSAVQQKKKQQKQRSTAKLQGRRGTRRQTDRGRGDDDNDAMTIGGNGNRAVIPERSTFVPSAFMVYTDLQSLRGLDAPTDYGSGIEYADGILEIAGGSGGGGGGGGSGSFSRENHNNHNNNVALQVGLWLNGSAGCRDIVTGKLDENIHRLLVYLTKKSPYAHAFLRVGYEFDNPDFGYSSKAPPSAATVDEQPPPPAVLYRHAYRYLVKKCRQLAGGAQCRHRVSFVWHSWAAGGGGDRQDDDYRRQLEDYYPDPATTPGGDNDNKDKDSVVDWIGVSIFQQFYGHNGGVGGTVDTLREVLDFAVEKNKPIAIAESAPFGGIDSMDDPWGTWFQPVLDLIDEYDIAMWSYIHCDWDSLPMWKGAGFGDTRLQTNATVLRLWRDRVLGSRRFLTAAGAAAVADRRDGEQGNRALFECSPAAGDDGVSLDGKWRMNRRPASVLAAYRHGENDSRHVAALGAGGTAKSHVPYYSQHPRMAGSVLVLLLMTVGFLVSALRRTQGYACRAVEEGREEEEEEKQRHRDEQSLLVQRKTPYDTAYDYGTRASL